MYTLRKKRIIIISIVSAILLIALVLGGVYAYTATDLFKSNQTLFFKYAGDAIGNLKYVENKQLSGIASLMEDTPYEIEGSLNVSYEGNTLNLLDIESKVNPEDEDMYAKVNLKSNNQNIFTLEYANSNNIYALKSDEIANAFIGVENDNLKVFAQKLGITDTTNIPDSIELKSIKSDVLELTENEMKHIYETYLPVLQKSISENKFKKDGNCTINNEGVVYNTTGYRLNLTQTELRDVIVAILNTLKEDSITLNMIATRAKALELGDDYTEINKLTKQIENTIEKLNETDTTEEEVISATIYVENGQVVETEIIISNRYKIIVYGKSSETTSKRYVSFEDLNNEDSKTEITENETRKKEESNYEIAIKNGDNTILISMDNKGSTESSELTTTVEFEMEIAGKTTIIEYEQEMKFDDSIQVLKVDRTNCAVLNDYTTEQLQALIQQLAERIQAVMNEKMQIISNNMQTSTTNVQTNKNVENSNIVENANNARENFINSRQQEMEDLQMVQDFANNL